MESTPGRQDLNDWVGAVDMLALFVNGMCAAYKIGLEVLGPINDVGNANREVAMPPGGLMPDHTHSGSDGDRMTANPRAATTQLVDVAPYLAEAAVIATANSLRYRQGLAQLAARQQWAFMQAGWGRMTGQAPSTPETCNVLVDEVRAYMREVGEISLLEARRLERDLALVSEKLARAIDPPDPDAPYRRFWAAKA
jgi:hypothetical protein